jgi:hypothetical protein
MPQQTTASMFRQGYTQTTPSLSVPYFSSALYIPWGNGQTYMNANGNYLTSYSTEAYTSPIPLPGSPMGFLPNHAYHNAMRFNAYGQPEVDGFSYETLPQFPFRPQPIDMMTAQATAEPCTDHNNLTNQLATIFHVSFGIEPKG